MKHQPTQLALLISLIGVGVAPCAFARSDARVIGAPEITLGSALDEVAAKLIDGRDSYPDLAWTPGQATVSLSEMPGALTLYSVGSDDWAPGESTTAATAASGTGRADLQAPERMWVPIEVLPVRTAKPRPERIQSRFAELTETRSAPVNAKRKQAGKPQRVRVLLQGPSIKARLAEIFKVDDAGAIERSARLTVATPVIEARAETAAAPGLGEPSSASPDALQPSVHAERLLEDLSAIVREGPTTATAPEQASSEPVPEPVATVTEVLPERRDASIPRIEPKEIVVAPESSKVLRSLGAILSEERDEVGAIRRDPVETIVSTQSGKVMAMLGEISAAQQEPVEDGAAKRARKRAALAAKAAAKAAQEQAAERAAEQAAVAAAASAIPADGADGASAADASVAEVPLALTPIAAAVSTAAPRAELEPRVSPFGSQRVAISEGSLDRVRGGFAGEGLNISFGIERAVYINGSLVTTTSLNVSTLGQVVAGRGVTTFDAGTLALIQSGAGNSVSTGSISSASMGTVVQNTLDGQKIQNITVINATANSLGLMRSMNLGSSLRGAVIDSLRR